MLQGVDSGSVSSLPIDNNTVAGERAESTKELFSVVCVMLGRPCQTPTEGSLSLAVTDSLQQHFYWRTEGLEEGMQADFCIQLRTVGS